MAEHKILIDDCEDAWNESVAAGVTSIADAVDYKVGAASAKISPDASVAAGTILATEARAALDISACQKVRLWIKSSVDTALGDLQILLDNHANCASPEETLDVPALSAGLWSLCDLPLANPESDTAIISIGLKYVTDLGACDIWVDDVNGCIVTPDYAETLIRGWYPALHKSIPVKVGDDGTVEIKDPVVLEMAPFNPIYLPLTETATAESTTTIDHYPAENRVWYVSKIYISTTTNTTAKLKIKCDNDGVLSDVEATVPKATTALEIDLKAEYGMPLRVVQLTMEYVNGGVADEDQTLIIKGTEVIERW